MRDANSMRQQKVSTAKPQTQASSRLLGDVLYFMAVFVVLLFLLLPFLWMVQNSFKTPLQILKLPADMIFKPTLDNYVNVLQTQNFL